SDAAEEPAEEPAEPVDEKTLGVETDGTSEIEFEIEGMKEKVTVVNYTLTPYNIQYQLRDLLKAPTVENGQVVHKAQMGNNEAIVSLEIMPGATLEEAVAEAQKAFA